MPEFNRNFAQGKMNKDLDERLVPAGQYRDAMNVEVSTSEGSDVGALENLLGNTNLTSDIVPEGSYCVGSIANGEEDCIYYLVQGEHISSTDLKAAPGSVKDYIIKFDIENQNATYVFVDIYKTSKQITGITPAVPGVDFGDDVGPQLIFDDNTGLKPGMTADLGAINVEGEIISTTDPNTGNVTNNSVLLNHHADVSNLAVGDIVVFTSPKILNFSQTRLITGINIVDDLIMWTDNSNEPKKVNIKRSIWGTGSNGFGIGSGANDNYSTRLVSRRDDGDFATPDGLEVKRADFILPLAINNIEPKYVQEEDITVKKRDPLTPPTLRMSETARCSNNLTTNIVNGVGTVVESPEPPPAIGGCDCQAYAACRRILNPTTALAAPFNLSQNAVSLMWPDGTPGSYVSQNGYANPFWPASNATSPFQQWFDANFPDAVPVSGLGGGGFINPGYTESSTGPVYYTFPDGSVVLSGRATLDAWTGINLLQSWGTTSDGSDCGNFAVHPNNVLNPDSPSYEENYITNTLWTSPGSYSIVDHGTGWLGQTPANSSLQDFFDDNLDELTEEVIVDGGTGGLVVESEVLNSTTVSTPDCVENPITTTLTNYGSFIDGSGNAIATGSNVNLVFDSAVDYRVDDVILLTNDLEQSPISFTEVQVRLQVIGVPAGADVNNIFNGVFICEVLSIDGTIATGDDADDWMVRLDQDPSLFEFTFPRFGYRYKYNDGEYSCFSPFSEIAFLPGGFDYSPKKGWNKAMANRLRSLFVENYAPLNWNRGKDIVEIDLLYKEEKSTTIYTVKTIKPTDGTPLWPTDNQYHNTNLRGSFQVVSEMIHAVVPSNQLIRPWDNVPRKALAQEVTGNRLVYGNYLHNYDLIDASGGLITPEINLGFVSSPHPLDLSAQKSLKSMRTYQVGVVYKDFLGRETPVLADKESGSVNVDKEFCDDMNSLQARVTSEPPVWAESFKYFIKETSAEYYNLALCKWYHAEDGNVWLSFNSSDRNKLDIDTFLELKKAHDSNTVVEEKARYKVIAIENEAPEDIRITKNEQGRVNNNAANTLIGSVAEGFPFSDRSFITIEGTAFENSFGTDPTYGYGAILADASNHCLRIYGAGARSEFYDIVRIESTGGFYKIHLTEMLGPDVNFASTADTWATRISGLSVAIFKKKSENKPEFDGKFFVKIYRDITIENYVMITSEESMTVDQAYVLPYLCSYDDNGDGTVNYASNSGNPAPNVSPYNANYTWGDNGWPGANEAAVRFRDGDDNSGFAGIMGGDGALMRRTIRTARSSNSAVPTGLAFWHFVSNINDGTILTDDNINKHRVRAFLDEGWAAGWWSDFEEDGDNDLILDGQGRSNENFPNYADDGDWSNEFVNLGIDTGAGYNNINDPMYISGPGDIISGASNANDYNWVQGSRGIYTINGVPMMDISVVNIRPGEGNTKWNTHFEDTNCEVVPGVAWPHTDQRSWLWRGYADTETGNQSVDQVKAFIDRLLINETKFRFREDPDREVYTIKSWREHTGITNMTLFNNVQNSDGDDCGNNNLGNQGDKKMITNNKRNKFTVALDKAPRNTFDPRSVMAHDMSMGDAITIEFLQPFGTEDGITSDNPAIFETMPKENIELDIYYELGRAYPIRLKKNNDETQALIGDIVNGPGWNGTSTIIDYHIEASNPQVCTLEINIAQTANAGDILTIDDAWDGQVQVEVDSNVAFASRFIPVKSLVHAPNLRYTLPWFNCYSFGNGVESDRIRDDFNQPTIQNGVKASTTIAEQYKEERRGSGLIYSGIYNTRTGVNRLNQFIQGEKITKDLNPDLGTIQKLFQRQTNLVTFCEDKVVKILSDKDALFNADGNANVTATARVLGAVTPFVGEYGISKNPESFASESYRAYFTDQQRGAVLRLSQDGITNISDLGMKDYFTDIMVEPDIIKGSRMLGTFDKRKDEYNLTISETPGKRKTDFIPLTVTYSEGIKGWTSFKSFIPEHGVSINNQYYTFKGGSLWQHHTNPTRNEFYGAPVGLNEQSTVTLLFNDMPSSVKNFQTVKYEGSQARINEFTTETINGVEYTDQNYYNLVGKDGWFVEYAETDLATAKVPEFINKEGKWFNNILGDCTTLQNLDENEFQTQGIGMATLSHDGTAVDRFGCTDPESTNYDPLANIDDGSCAYPEEEVIKGCTDPNATNYDPNAQQDDGTCEYCDCEESDFTIQIVNVLQPTLNQENGRISATGVSADTNFNQSLVTMVVLDSSGQEVNPDALGTGHYEVVVTEPICGCTDTQMVTLVGTGGEGPTGTDTTVDFWIGESSQDIDGTNWD